MATARYSVADFRHLGGRLKSRYFYSVDLDYNSFPTPPDSQTGVWTCRCWNDSLRPSSTPALGTPKRRWQTVTMRIPCRLAFAGRIRHCGGPTLSPERVPVRARANRAPVHPLREDVCASRRNERTRRSRNAEEIGTLLEILETISSDPSVCVRRQGQHERSDNYSTGHDCQNEMEQFSSGAS